MKNRLFLMLLCLVLVFSAGLVGCSKSNAEEDLNKINKEASASNISLTMWVVSEEPVDTQDVKNAKGEWEVKSTATRINEAVNKITKTKFKTALTIKFFTEDEYQDKLTDAIRAYENNRGNIKVVEEVTTDESGNTVTTEEVTALNEYGLPEVVYPALLANQVDIIYIADKDMYYEFADNGWLSPLDTELSSSSKRIKEYVSSALLAAAKYKGSTYAIPNNETVGNYQVMLLDKKVMDATATNGLYESGQISSLFNEYIYSMLDDVANGSLQYFLPKTAPTAETFANGEYYTVAGGVATLATVFDEDAIYYEKLDYVPVDATYEECLALLAHFWSVDGDTLAQDSREFSALGYLYTDAASLSRGTTSLTFNSLFANAKFRDAFLKLNEYRLAGTYFNESVPAGKKAAVTFTECGVEDLKAYRSGTSDYYPVILRYPTVTADDVYDGMFGVYTYTRDLSRSMQIITYLTTNAEFRNLLQYGVEGEDWELINNRVEYLDPQTSPYRMNIFKTGNAFLAYLPDDTENFPANIWENGKEQNREAVVDPLLNFNFKVEAFGSAVAADKKAGDYRFTTGYSKEILSQNKVIKTWLEECDRAGKGIYVLNSSATSGQNTDIIAYFYNNNVSGNVKVTNDVTASAFTLDYATASGSSATPGYELSVVTGYAKKNSVLALGATLAGKAATVVEKKMNSLITFDFNDTATYEVTANTNVTKAMLEKNAVALNWINTCGGTVDTPAVLKGARTVGNKTYYTYLLYIGTTKTNTVTVQTTGDANNVNVSVDFVGGSENSDKSYQMTLVTVVADNGVNVNFNLTKSGAAYAANETVNNTDVLPRLWGTLDVELVRYFDLLNEAILNQVNACTTAEELKEVIDELGKLFTLRDEITKELDISLWENAATELPMLKAGALASWTESDFRTFNWNLTCATSKATVNHMLYDEETGKMGISKVSPVSGEDYYYFQSPYMVYAAWLKANNLAK